jgi:hypothetical protein
MGYQKSLERRTPDLYRVNFDVNHLKSFNFLAFPVFLKIEIPLKQPSFGDELVTSSSALPGR